MAAQPSTPAHWRVFFVLFCFYCVCFSFPLSNHKRWSLGKGERGRTSVWTVFTRPPALSLSPAPSSEKKSFLEKSLLSLPTSGWGLGAGSWERAVPSALGSAAPRARKLAGAAAPQSSESGARVAATGRADRKGPHRNPPLLPPAPPPASP